MVTVINAQKREGQNGSFMVLELLGGIEMVQSQTTGKFYATARRCSVPSSFDERTAHLMIGSKLQGTIERVQCDSYDFTVKESGEVIKLAHTYEYRPPQTDPVFVKSQSALTSPLHSLVNN
jgi:hypothetical protein